MITFTNTTITSIITTTTTTIIIIIIIITITTTTIIIIIVGGSAPHLPEAVAGPNIVIISSNCAVLKCMFSCS